MQISFALREALGCVHREPVPTLSSHLPYLSTLYSPAPPSSSAPATQPFSCCVVNRPPPGAGTPPPPDEPLISLLHTASSLLCSLPTPQLLLCSLLMKNLPFADIPSMLPWVYFKAPDADNTALTFSHSVSLA
ncbi:hypothetical protein KIL84_021815 [Mauremys mutica]|uniref:Uncharacterized protein n=1 Tax=Mauremys mutica TaxID=74926 RepID=A0A9D4AWP9_9SAUR|nr:hypothetical protein KIL84_021815 [Mauremys mutica]